MNYKVALAMLDIKIKDQSLYLHLIQIVLIFLKLTVVQSVSWHIILIPAYLYFGVFLAIFLIYIFVPGSRITFKRANDFDKKN